MISTVTQSSVKTEKIAKVKESNNGHNYHFVLILTNITSYSVKDLNSARKSITLWFYNLMFILLKVNKLHLVPCKIMQLPQKKRN